MRRWVREQNIRRYEQLIAQASDEETRAIIATLLAEERAALEDANVEFEEAVPPKQT